MGFPGDLEVKNLPMQEIRVQSLGWEDPLEPTKVCLVKAMVFPVVMYRCESWTIKKAEC